MKNETRLNLMLLVCGWITLQTCFPESRDIRGMIQSCRFPLPLPLIGVGLHDRKYNPPFPGLEEIRSEGKNHYITTLSLISLLEALITVQFTTRSSSHLEWFEWLYSIMSHGLTRVRFDGNKARSEANEKKMKGNWISSANKTGNNRSDSFDQPTVQDAGFSLLLSPNLIRFLKSCSRLCKLKPLFLSSLVTFLYKDLLLQSIHAG